MKITRVSLFIVLLIIANITLAILFLNKRSDYKDQVDRINAEIEMIQHQRDSIAVELRVIRGEKQAILDTLNEKKKEIEESKVRLNKIKYKYDEIYHAINNQSSSERIEFFSGEVSE